jgi:ferredoxin
MRTDSVEREIDGILVRIDRLLCVGFESCAEIAPEVFRLDANGLAEFTASPARRGGDSAPERSRPEAARPDPRAPACDRARLLEACRSCPWTRWPRST